MSEFHFSEKNIDTKEFKDSGQDNLDHVDVKMKASDQTPLEKADEIFNKLWSSEYSDENSQLKKFESKDTKDVDFKTYDNGDKNKRISLEEADAIFQKLFDDFDSKEDKDIESNKPEEKNEKLDNVDETKENDLTEKEINELQIAAIKEALERIRNGEKLTEKEKGNLGEMMMDQYYISKGYHPLNKNRVTSLDDSGHQGIDGVYERTKEDGSKEYVIADAKYNTAKQDETNDGKQLSANWIDKRLDNAVGKEKADEIRDAYEDDPDSVKSEIYHIDPNPDEDGNIHTDTQEVDADGNKIGDKNTVETYDKNGDKNE